MLSQSLREQFLEKQVTNFTPIQLINHYLYFFEKYSKTPLDHPTEVLGDCLWYLKKLLVKHHPSVSMKLICASKGIAPSLQNIEENYIRLMHTVALLELYHEEYRSAAHWAKKTVDFISFFHPCTSTPDRLKLIENDPFYFDCFKLYLEKKDFFDEGTHRKFVFEWEKRFFEPSDTANRNDKA